MLRDFHSANCTTLRSATWPSQAPTTRTHQPGSNRFLFGRHVRSFDMVDTKSLEQRSVTVANGTLTFTGPPPLLEHPLPDEVHRAIEATAWRCEFERIHAEGQARMGLVETRF